MQNSGELVRRGAFHVTFAPTSFPSDDPSRCALLCSRNVPTEANGFTGANVSRIADAAHDAAWDLVNSEVDEAKRMEALKAAYDLTAELVPVLPYAPGLVVLVYNSDRLRAVVNEPGPSGPDTTKWFCLGGTC